MPPSIPAFDSAELAPAGASAEPRLRARLSWRAVLRGTSGTVGIACIGVTLAMAIVGPLVAGDPFALAAAPLLPPSWSHPMGTDALGRDLWLGVTHGARTSLGVAGAVTLLASLCGAVVGLSAGWGGGILDDVLMRVTELFQVLPRFFLVVVAVALFGHGTDRVVLALGLTGWPVLARVVRGEVLALRDLDFILAARASGASNARIICRQLLPNVLPSAAVMSGLLFGQVLLIEASLGFLGLGDPNAISWGLLAGQARGFLRDAWWVVAFPGLAVATAVLGVNLLADALAAALSGR